MICRYKNAKRVDNDLRGVPSKISNRIVGAIEKLVGFETGYRLNVSNYRVIYQIHDTVVVNWVIEIGHRKDIYR